MFVVRLLVMIVIGVWCVRAFGMQSDYYSTSDFNDILASISKRQRRSDEKEKEPETEQQELPSSPSLVIPLPNLASNQINYFNDSNTSTGNYTSLELLSHDCMPPSHSLEPAQVSTSAVPFDQEEQPLVMLAGSIRKNYLEPLSRARPSCSRIILHSTGYCRMTAERLKLISSYFPRLTHITIESGVAVHPETIRALVDPALFKNLTHLRFVGCSFQENMQIALFQLLCTSQRARQLKELTITNTTVSYEVVELLCDPKRNSGMKNLEHFTISHNIVLQLPHSYLALGHHETNDAGEQREAMASSNTLMPLLGQAPFARNLVSLNLAGLGITSQGIRRLMDTFENLQELDISDNPLRDQGVAQLSGIIRRLKKLSIGATNSTSTGVLRLEMFKNLTELVVSCNNLAVVFSQPLTHGVVPQALVRLRAADTGLTASHAEYFALFATYYPHLQFLDVSGNTELGYEGVLALIFGVAPALRELDVRHTGLTQQQKMRLKEDWKTIKLILD